MRVIIQQSIDDEEGVTLGEIEFSPVPGQPDSFLIHEHALQRADRSSLVISAAYSLLNDNFSMFVSFEGEHVFTAACHWDLVAPFFAFRLKDGSFIECFFAK